MTQIIVRRKYNNHRDGVAHPEQFMTPKDQWVVGVMVGDTWFEEHVWPSVDAARAFAEARGFMFTTWVPA